jgi:hypothetical protein
MPPRVSHAPIVRAVRLPHADIKNLSAGRMRIDLVPDDDAHFFGSGLAFFSAASRLMAINRLIAVARAGVSGCLRAHASMAARSSGLMGDADGIEVPDDLEPQVRDYLDQAPDAP